MHLEAATARRNQLHLLVREGTKDLRRQTGGARFVVSDRAILDRDHCLITSANVFRKATHSGDQHSLHAIGRYALWPLVDIERVPIR